MHPVSFLAQIDPAQAGAWMQTFFWFAGGIAGVLASIIALKKLREEPPAGTPQPLVVRGEDDFIPRPEYERDRSETRAEYERDRTEIRSELSRQSVARKALYERLEEQGRMIQSTATKTDLTYAQMQHVDAKMDRVLERLPRKSSD